MFILLRVRGSCPRLIPGPRRFDARCAGAVASGAGAECTDADCCVAVSAEFAGDAASVDPVAAGVDGIEDGVGEFDEFEAGERGNRDATRIIERLLASP